MTDDLHKMLNKSLGKLEDAVLTIKRRNNDLEDEIQYLEAEIDRLGEKVQDMEIYDHDNLRLHSLIRNLYISKISLSPSLFERELKSFFMESIDKRL